MPRITASEFKKIQKSFFKNKPFKNLMEYLLSKGKSIEEQTNQIKAANTFAAQRDARAVEALIQVLKVGLLYPKLAASEALGVIGSPSIAPLIEQIGKIKETQNREPPKEAFWDKSYYVHDPAARTLVRVGKPAIAALVDVVEKEIDFKAQQAIDALGRIGDESSVKILIGVFSKRHDPMTLWKIVRAVGETHSVYGTKFLCNVLSDSKLEPYIRWEAADSLGKIADPVSIDYLIAGINNENVQIRRASARSLGKLKDNRAIKPLKTLLAAIPKNINRKSVYFEAKKALSIIKNSVDSD